MAKSRVAGSLWSELGAFGFYKRNQGRLARQLTALAMILVVCFGAWTLSQTLLLEQKAPVRLGIPLAIVVVSGWFIFRLVNWSPFADFLIDVEGEMNKVSWASGKELYRATIVVVVTMVFLSLVLFLYDVMWQEFLRLINVLQI